MGDVVESVVMPEGPMVKFIGESSQLIPADEASINELIVGRNKMKLTDIKPGEFNFWSGAQGPLPKYLIRVDVGPQSTVHGDLTVIFSFWQFPKMPNLDYIEQIYVCEAEGCNGILPAESRARMSQGPAMWYCPKCFAFWQEGDKREELRDALGKPAGYKDIPLLPGARGYLGSGMYAYERTAPALADVTARYWERFGGLCEIMIMRRRLSVQRMAKRWLAGDGGSEADIEYAHSAGSDPKTGVVGCYYTLAGLQKDTAAGSTLSSRLAVFFSGG